MPNSARAKSQYLLLCRIGFVLVAFGFRADTVTAAALDQDSFVSIVNDQFSPQIYLLGSTRFGLGQTFVAGISGNLNRIEIQLIGFATPAIIKYSLISGDKSVTDGAQLATGIIGRFPYYFQSTRYPAVVDLSSQSVKLSAGLTYSLLLEPYSVINPLYNMGYTGWDYGPSIGSTAFTGSSLSRNNGGAWVRYLNARPSNGFGFKTYVTQQTAGVPEPATWVTMLLGFFATAVFVRRRRANSSEKRPIA